jgi:hypothetical protein
MADIKTAVRFTQEHERRMHNLSPEIQAALKTMQAAMVAGGTIVEGAKVGDPAPGTIWMEQDGKLVRLTIFEVGFILGRMYEQDKGNPQAEAA